MPTNKIQYPGQKKLASLGLTLPLFPTSPSSSLPKHQDLSELRYKVAKGVQSTLELERKEKISTEIWIRQLEKIQMDVLTDGEMYRGDMIAYFAQKIKGFEQGGIVRCYGNRYYPKPVIRSKLEWKGPLVQDYWKFFQRMSHKPMKAVVTGPITLVDWSFNEFYESRESAIADATAVIRKEIQDLVEAGAKIIQIDEPALSSHPENFNLAQDSIKELTKNLKAYFILHHIYGDLQPLEGKWLKLTVDNFYFDGSPSLKTYLDILKKNSNEKDFTFGVIDSSIPAIENSTNIIRNLQPILKVIPHGRIWLAPNTTLKKLTIESATGKLKSLSETAQKLRLKFK